jgi:hypothetical protein
MEWRNAMTRFLGAVVAVAFLAGTGCYATVQGPPGHPSTRHYDGDEHYGNQDRDDQRGNRDREHARSNYGGDKDHD